MFYAFTRGVATYEAFAVPSVVETIDIPDESCKDLAGEMIGVCTRSMSSSVTTTDYDYNYVMLIFGMINFFVVTNCFFGLLQMCDQVSAA